MMQRVNGKKINIVAGVVSVICYAWNPLNRCVEILLISSLSPLHKSSWLSFYRPEIFTGRSVKRLLTELVLCFSTGFETSFNLYCPSVLHSLFLAFLKNVLISSVSTWFSSYVWEAYFTCKLEEKMLRKIC